jgi:hypothetical protein
MDLHRGDCSLFSELFRLWKGWKEKMEQCHLVLIHSGTALYSKYPLFMLQLFLATFMEFTLFVEVTSVTYSFYYKIIAYQAYTWYFHSKSYLTF